MTLYAQVADGVIVELFSPPDGIDITDCFHAALTWVDITGRDPQPDVGWIATFANGIWTITAPVTPTLTPAQQASNILGTGVQILSATDPSLSGVYPIDTEARVSVIAEMVSIEINAAFTDGTTTLGMLDTSNQPHTFDIDHFRSYATVVGEFVTALKMVAAGTSNTLPTQPIWIM